MQPLRAGLLCTLIPPPRPQKRANSRTTIAYTLFDQSAGAFSTTVSQSPKRAWTSCRSNVTRPSRSLKSQRDTTPPKNCWRNTAANHRSSHPAPKRTPLSQSQQTLHSLLPVALVFLRHRRRTSCTPLPNYPLRPKVMALLLTVLHRRRSCHKTFLLQNLRSQ